MAVLDDILDVLRRMEKQNDTNIKTEKEKAKNDKAKNEKVRPGTLGGDYGKSISALGGLNIPGASSFFSFVGQFVKIQDAALTARKKAFLDASTGSTSKFNPSQGSTASSGMATAPGGMPSPGADKAMSTLSAAAGVESQPLIGLIVAAINAAIVMINNYVRALKDVVGVFSDIKSAAQGKALDFIENLGDKLGDRAESFFTHAFGAVIPFFGEAIGGWIGAIVKAEIAIITLPFTIKNFAESILSLNTQFAEMSGPMAMVAAKWEVFKLLLSQKMGDALSPAAAKLEASLEKLFEALAPFIVIVIEVLTAIVTYVVDFTVKALEALEAFLDTLPFMADVMKILKDMRELLKKEPESIAGDFVDDLARQYRAGNYRPVNGFPGR